MADKKETAPEAEAATAAQAGEQTAAEGAAKTEATEQTDTAEALVPDAEDRAPVPKRGRPASGRAWKQPRKRRSSAAVPHLKKDMGADGKGRSKKSGKKSSAFERRQKEKQKRNRMKELEAELINNRIERKRAERERRMKAAKKREEANFTNTTFQAIKASKLKTMSKKQLRQVRKTSVEADGTVVLISPWQKRADHHHIAVRGKRKATGRRRA